jgi:hypothetical protein
MWILSILPVASIHLLLICGVLGTIAGFVLGFIPLINKYRLPIQILGVLMLSLAVYLEGGLANDAEWQLKVKEMEAKVAEAKAQSLQVNTTVVTKILTKRQIIKEKGDEIRTYIDREVVKYDTTCPIPEVVINAHNAAALPSTAPTK